MSRFAVVPLLVLMSAVTLTATQDPSAPPQPTFRSTASMVAVNVTVLDGPKLVSGLTQNDFEVYEDGVRQQVRFFESRSVPLDVILLLDTSSSMTDKMNVVHEAARGFMKILRPADRGAVVTFADSVNVVQDLTSDAGAIEAAINSARANGATSLRNAISLDDRFAEAHYLLGVCLHELQRTSEAAESLVRALELNAALLPAREELVAVYGRLHRHDQQNRQLEVLAGLDPRSPREVALALAYARDGKADRAVLRLRNAARLFPGDQLTHAALGRVWLQRAENGGATELDKALEALEAATAHEPTSEALTLYGRALMASGQLVRAHNVLTQAVRRFPVDPLAFYYLADVAERRGQTRIAQRALIDYAALEGVESPHLSAGVLARIAEAQLSAGNASAAWQAAERALKKDPANAQALLVWARLR